MPRFSIIMPSYLGEYKGAATNREFKLRRAIESVLNQSFTDFELIIVADACEKTFNIAEEYTDKRLDCLLTSKKMPIWTPYIRNVGLKNAKGEIVVYLDSDDYYGKDHLKIINDNFGNYDWVWYNDLIGNNNGEFKERQCHINVKFQNGTSNIAHKRSINVLWTSCGYGNDDYGFIDSLRNIARNYTKIPTAQYHVCHLVNILDI